MLTPAFDLSQDPDFLTIAIRVPYARVSEFDVYFEGSDFKFYAKPYFLRNFYHSPAQRNPWPAF
ncbi:SHQ1, H/ACA ribonucleoprotein assembly factor [Homo sapiens]|uniref:SHQ1, H/ACA ribonucleoprotein assembly factor n=6 Tax=Catarrhini TaxID=9526 RepID=F8WBC6_HUMAN|nr:SHQ1, H/ACA ribonucleoprotein assembly factor [Homo sapiens]KAI4030503.1 SHQ1, H/ACA ribonucleoprotein assembly factor [Homo sapiens]PNJ25119.1 SHQ1 isoform 9 [Pongo abelii]